LKKTLAAGDSKKLLLIRDLGAGASNALQ
jgi:hypothetical protein